jgi:mono/diheme cytochrome c family protein
MRAHFVHGLFAGAAALALVGFTAPSFADKPAATTASGADQAAEGSKLYGKYCAKCHGNAGQGTKKAPAVVGKDALPLDPPATAKVRKTQFHTAQDVAAFVATKMPANKPGSLTADQYYEILAFDLKANGVDVTGKKINPTTAAEIKLH